MGRRATNGPPVEADHQVRRVALLTGLDAATASGQMLGCQAPNGSAKCQQAPCYDDIHVQRI